MANDGKYVLDMQVEKKGKGFAGWKSRQLRLSQDAVLTYFTIPQMGDGKTQEELKGTIDLMVEGLNQVQPDKKLKGKLYKYGWIMQTDGRKYEFASSDEKDRKLWIKQIQDIYQQTKNSAKGKKAQKQEATKTKKSWGSALKSFKETAKSGGVGSAMQKLKQDAHDLKKQKFRAKKEKKKVTATLDTSSIFGCYNVMEDGKDSTLYNKKEEKKSDDDSENKEENKHPLMIATLPELLNPNVHTFSSKLGAKASRFNKITSFNDDLIASNEFCQIAVGKGLLRGHETVEDTKDNKDEEAKDETKSDLEPVAEDEEQKDDPSDDAKATTESKLRVNRRPADDTSDDEAEEEKDDERIPIPQLRHPGTLREKIDFRPGNNNFTICCEIFCEDVAAGNTILSNRIAQSGFEFIAPRPGSRRMAVWMEGNQLLNVGQTELFQQAIVCRRANVGTDSKLQRTESVFAMKKEEDNEKKKKKPGFKIGNLTNMSGTEMIEKMTGKTKITSEATDFAVYLNGVIDGKLSFDGVPALDTLDCRIGSNVDMTMTSCFNGKIKNFEMFDRALNEEEIYLIAHKKGNYSLQDTVLLSYIPESLKVEIPIYNVKYNGPIHCALPSHLQWQPGLNSFTISAWIMCSRNKSKMGSVILSNLTTSNNGFELICPTNGNDVIGIKKTGIREDNGLQLGTTVIEKNKFYHICVVVERVITYGAEPDSTSIVVYVNGKQDGSYNIGTIFNYSGGDWTIGYNGHYKLDTSFEGAISNLRIFQRPLIEAEIATIYAADLREREFVKNEEIHYIATKQDSDEDDGSAVVSNQHLTYFEEKKWEKGTFIKWNLINGKVTLLDKTKNQKEVAISEIVKMNDKISQFVPGSDSSKINNLGGMIHGTTFKGEKWRIYSEQTEFLRHITTNGIFTLLSKLKPFTKYTFEQMIENKEINNKYLLNRLLYSAHELLKNVNANKSLWSYFNEYILPWKLWKNDKNFKLLQEIARNLQYKYKKAQFDLFDQLKEKNPNWKAFKIEHESHETIENRQDGFDGGLTVEFDQNVVSKELATNYDKQVSSMILYGRCSLLNDKFQKCIKDMFTDKGQTSDAQWMAWNATDIADFILKIDDKYKEKYDKDILISKLNEEGINGSSLSKLQIDDLDKLGIKSDDDKKKIYDKLKVIMMKFYFKPAPQKTYERMVEKTVEYQSENAKFPAAYRICDVLRCSITCHNLDDVGDGLNILRDNITIVRIKNRFLPSFDSKQTDGYRDMLVNVLYKDEITKLSAICEVQFQLKGYLDIKKKQHKYYKIVRAIDYKSLLRNYEARKYD